MEQDLSEAVSDFTHRFREVQHGLEQHVPTIHYTPPPNSEDNELRQASLSYYVLKLRNSL